MRLWTGLQRFEIFLTCPPGLEAVLVQEAIETGFSAPRAIKGGVIFQGGWQHVWRANLELRCATRVLVRLARFEAKQLSQLQQQASMIDWDDYLRAGCQVSVEAQCRKSRIYHSGAAAERVETAIVKATGGAVIIAGDDPADINIKLRIDRDVCTLSLDSSGTALYQRGHKQAIGKAPLRETLASAFLRLAGFDGKEPVLDPMCGSGTFVIEAAERAAKLSPGRSRSFAFEHLASYDGGAIPRNTDRPDGPLRYFGSDRDKGAIEASQANAERAGLAAITQFEQRAVSDIAPPTDEPGLIIANPPYGARMGDKRKLFALYGALGQVALARFSGWRVALVTTEANLAQATGLPWRSPSAPIDHGGLKLHLYQTEALD